MLTIPSDIYREAYTNVILKIKACDILVTMIMNTLYEKISGR